MVDSPRAGALPAAEEIEALFLKFGGPSASSSAGGIATLPNLGCGGKPPAVRATLVHSISCCAEAEWVLPGCQVGGGWQAPGLFAPGVAGALKREFVGQE